MLLGASCGSAAVTRSPSNTQSSTELARQQLQQSRDRFSAGVDNNIEVVQAQESVATSDENYISSLYAYNLAKASLARALGTAAVAIKSFLGVKFGVK